METSRVTPVLAPANLGAVLEQNTLSPGDRDAAACASSYLLTAFDWREAAEGFEFWSSVHKRLSRISEGEPLR
jgi:hypothetical protein